MKLGDVIKYEGIIENSEPSHDYIFDPTFIERLRDITCRHASMEKLAPSTIPSDLIDIKHIAIPDLYIRIGEFGARARVVLFKCGSVHGSRSKKIIPMGAVIYEYGDLKPEVFFGVQPNDCQIKVIDGIWWNRSKSEKENKEYRARFGLENIGKLSMTYEILKLWYAIQASYEYKAVYKDEYEQLRHQIRWCIDQRLLCKRLFEEESGKRREWRPHKDFFFQPGHTKHVTRKNSNGEKERVPLRIKPGWRFRHDDSKQKKDAKWKKIKQGGINNEQS